MVYVIGDPITPGVRRELERLKEAGGSINALAAKSGVSQTLLWRIQQGERRALMKISKVLRVPLTLPI